MCAFYRRGWGGAGVWDRGGEGGATGGGGDVGRGAAWEVKQAAATEVMAAAGVGEPRGIACTSAIARSWKGNVAAERGSHACMWRRFLLPLFGRCVASVAVAVSVPALAVVAVAALVAAVLGVGAAG